MRYVGSMIVERDRGEGGKVREKEHFGEYGLGE